MRTISWRSALWCGWILAAVLLCVVESQAQQTLGSINGTVLDASGAAVTDAQVTVTDAAINVSRTTATQKTGFYQFFNLPV